MGTGKTAILGLLVVAATVAAIVLLRKEGDSEGGAGGAAAKAAEPVEIAPLVPHGRITSNSWSTSADGPEEDEGDESDLDLVSHHDRDREEEARAAKSLEATVREVEGLGVYIAPAEESKAPGKSGR